MRELLSDVPERALAVYAHPDDPDVSCGGTLALWAREGAEIHEVLCTNGDKGTSDSTVEPAELALTREDEAASAAKLIGVAGRHKLGYSDGGLPEGSALVRELVVLIRELRPAMVLCPDPTAVFFGEDYFNHRDHRVVGLAVLDAVAPAAALPLYFPDAGPAHQVQTTLMSGTLEPSVWIDIASTIDTKISAVSCHRTQFPEGVEWAGRAVRLRAEEDGRTAGVRYAEGFRRLRLGV